MTKPGFSNRNGDIQCHILRVTVVTTHNIFHENLIMYLKWYFEGLHQFMDGEPQFQLTPSEAAEAVRVIRSWNRLKPYVAKAPSLSALNERLDNSCPITVNRKLFDTAFVSSHINMFDCNFDCVSQIISWNDFEFSAFLICHECVHLPSATTWSHFKSIAAWEWTKLLSGTPPASS